MTKDEVIATLRRHQAELEEQGVQHAALFGSLARDEAGPDSDIDIMIDIEPEASRTMGIFDLVELQLLIGDLFEGRVDVVESEGFKRHVKPSAVRDAIYAF
jgi:hypothetical protein